MINVCPKLLVLTLLTQTGKTVYFSLSVLGLKVSFLAMMSDSFSVVPRLALWVGGRRHEAVSPGGLA